jgi:putative membrane protein
MDYMFQPGFLGTRAPLFMDFVAIIVALLPLLIAIAIRFAIKHDYKTHALLQKFLFIVSLIVVGYFEYGVRQGGGFELFMQESHSPYNYALWVLIIHIIIAVITLSVWLYTLLSARKDSQKKVLPGLYSSVHKKLGKVTYIFIVLTSLTGLWVYYLLFVY